MKKHPLPAWAGCLLLIAITLIGTLRFWLPITAESGESYTLRLQRAYHADNTLWLDFGLSDDFRMPYADADSDLLSSEAVGKEFFIIADYHARRRGSDYYDVYALSRVDGPTYLTIEQSEAQRLGMLPLRITLFVVLDGIICGAVILAERRSKAARQAVDSIPEESEETEESPHV